MKRTLRKDMLKAFLQSKGRLVSIVSLMMLGVFAFIGLKATKPNIQTALMKQLEEYRVMDLAVLSPYGIIEKDTQELNQLTDAQIEYGYLTDVLVDDASLRLFSMPHTISQFQLVEGRFPANEQEIAIYLAPNRAYQIGDTIQLKEASNQLISSSFTITGFILSNELLSTTDLGSSTTGSGTLDGYGVVVPTAFQTEVYSIARVRYHSLREKNPFDEQYIQQISEYQRALEAMLADNGIQRYEELREEIRQKLQDGREKIDQAKMDLEDGRTKLAQAQQEIEDGWRQWQDGQQQLEKKQQELENAFQTIVAGKKELEATAMELAAGERALQQASVQLKELEAKVAQFEQQLQQVQPPTKQLEQQYQQLKAQYTAFVQQYNEKKTQLSSGQQAYQNGVQQLQIAQQKYEQGNVQIQQAQAQLQEKAEVLRQGETELASQKEQFETLQVEAQDAIEKGEKELEDGQKALEQLRKPEYTVYTRRTLPGGKGYVMIATSTKAVDELGNVFPVILFAVALLVTITTMTRFVLDERLHSGLLIALGYSKWDTMKKFLLYGGVASTIGSVLGMLFGTYFLPPILAKVLLATTTVQLPPVHFYSEISLIAYSCALGCCVIPSIWIASSELKEQAAALLQAKPPVQASSIFLERISFLWDSLSFTYKVTVRNIFRYKQRMLMTIFGVAGSVALLFAGLGIRSSLSGVVERQFGSIIQYDAIVSIQDGASKEDIAQLTDTLSTHQEVEAASSIYMEVVKQKIEGIQDEQEIVSMVVSQDELAHFVKLYDAQTKQSIELGQDGVAISHKLAQLLNKQVGDTFDYQGRTLSISHIVEMYAGHYMYMSKEYAAIVLGEEISSNAYLVNMVSNQQETIRQVASDLVTLPAVATVVQNETLINQVAVVISSLGTAMDILTLVSVLLAVVILYNLTTINIVERIRELSTIKVLGFFNDEVTMYIYRETIILSLVGIGCGLVSGKWLHQLILSMIAPDMILFNPTVPFNTYIVPVVSIVMILCVLGLWVNRTLKKIDMLEALKSVD